jgi:hypothetical protein
MYATTPVSFTATFASFTFLNSVVALLSAEVPSFTLQPVVVTASGATPVIVASAVTFPSSTAEALYFPV